VQADDSDQLQNNHQRDAPDFVHHTKARCEHEDSNRQQKVIELSTLTATHPHYSNSLMTFYRLNCISVVTYSSVPITLLSAMGCAGHA